MLAGRPLSPVSVLARLIVLPDCYVWFWGITLVASLSPPVRPGRSSTLGHAVLRKITAGSCASRMMQGDAVYV